MDKLVLDNVTCIYNQGTPFEVRALDGVSLSIKEGAVTGIIGHTGSGKSTMVQLFNGLLKPTDGKVLLDGVDIWEKKNDIRAVRFKVGLVMQYPEYQLFEDTVYADIAYAPKNMGLDPEETDKRVRESARFVGLDEETLKKSPFELSGGQMRRVAIAGIFAMKPEVLVLDEPAAGLDPCGRDMIFGGIFEYQRNTGATVIIVSHSMEDMARYCDEIVVLSGSKLLMQGTRNEVFANSDELSKAGLDVPQITKLVALF